ncbi:hypothetical protein GCM10010336_63580 [Streptomyces goshikiensis]|nr:hypothetical protein GCM10010336_63580 [Streptomyces goshikiensis]
MGITGGQGGQDGHEFRADFAVRSGEERAQLPRRGALRAKPEVVESTGVAALDTFAEGQRALAEAAPAERPVVRRAAGHVSKVRADAARFPAPAARRAERPAIGGPGIDLVGGAAVRAGLANVSVAAGQGDDEWGAVAVDDEVGLTARVAWPTGEGPVSAPFEGPDVRSVDRRVVQVTLPPAVPPAMKTSCRRGHAPASVIQSRSRRQVVTPLQPTCSAGTSRQLTLLHST